MIPTEIRVQQSGKVLYVTFENEASYQLSAEYLRVHSPSAEVKGHGAAEPILVMGKAEVGIAGIEPVGNYAIKLIFSDGHQSGIYGWAYLYELASQYQVKWQHYLARLAKAPDRVNSAIPTACGKK